MKVTLEIREDVPIRSSEVRDAVVHYLSHHRGVNGKKAGRRVKVVGVQLDVPLVKYDQTVFPPELV